MPWGTSSFIKANNLLLNQQMGEVSAFFISIKSLGEYHHAEDLLICYRTNCCIHNCFKRSINANFQLKLDDRLFLTSLAPY
jgi:hypothetical protein